MKVTEIPTGLPPSSSLDQVLLVVLLISHVSFNPPILLARCNTSLLIDYCSRSSEHNYIMIDVGKTFREQVLRWFTRYNIPRVDSIILTHEHADAIHGLDDVRALQNYRIDADPMPIYLNQFTMDGVAEKFRYLVPSNLNDDRIVRPISQIDWKIIKSCSETPFIASGLKFVPLPVIHGEGYVNLGFLFGEKYKVAYISDVSDFPENTENVISKNRSGRQVDLLLIDTNRFHKTTSRGSHYYFSQSLDAVRRISPKRALLIGMSHDFDYHEHNKILAEWSKEEGIPVQLACDGMQIFTDGL
ncbi:Beta-lactamase domain protein [Zostera marina]|uniref:Beta-lactamase domain protein n=1 Tax=Zostera marina TaxID=29655 RepID=A0A0K9PSQ7_ZOSMR|nr:Beta-lactamase domain protein [Zostera marina]